MLLLIVLIIMAALYTYSRWFLHIHLATPAIVDPSRDASLIDATTVLVGLLLLQVHSLVRSLID